MVLRENIMYRLVEYKFASDKTAEQVADEIINGFVDRIIDPRINQIKTEYQFNENTKSWDLVECDEVSAYYKMMELEDLKNEILKK